MPFVQVTMVRGRTVEQKRALIASVSAAVAAAAETPVERVRVAIYEVGPEEWGIGGEPYSVVRGEPGDRPARAPSAVTWVRLLRAADLGEAAARRVSFGDRAICVGLADGRPRAVDDRCPHREAALSGGVVSDGVITCPGHFRRFDLRTGECIGRPQESVRGYQCAVVDGWVEADIPPPALSRSLRDVLLAHARGGGRPDSRLPSTPSQPPPEPVLAAFGAPGARPRPLGGGQGTSWVAAGVVLKPADLDRDELDWQARIGAQVRGAGFRLARPVTAVDGALIVDGWCATEYLSGQHEPARWAEIITVGERLHAAMRGLPRPAFLDRRSGPWATSDRVAWGELPAGGFPHVGHLPRLAAAVRPVPDSSQLIHGDLTGNVLFDGRLPPAIIDLSPYWRPAAYASAIVVADALVWEGASSQILEAVGHIADFGQYLIRALIFRLVTDWLLTGAPAESRAHDDRWIPAIDLACRIAAPP